MEKIVEEKPFLVIEPRSSFSVFDWRELIHYHELFYFFVLREIKIRYKQTIFGFAWAVIQPFFSMIIFTLFFGKLAGIPSDGMPYPLFSYTAMIIWTFFAQSITFSSQSMIMNTNMVTKIYFPRIIIPVAPILSCILDFIIAFSLLILLMPYYSYMPSANIWAAPISLLITLLATLGMGLWLSAATVKYRDFRYVVPFLIQFWMFCSPVVYPASLIPERWRLWYALNPMTGAIEGFRWALLGTDLNVWPMFGVSGLSAIVLFSIGIFYFRKTEKYFADLI